jgi:hypothetical protein
VTELGHGPDTLAALVGPSLAGVHAGPMRALRRVYPARARFSKSRVESLTRILSRLLLQVEFRCRSWVYVAQLDSHCLLSGAVVMLHYRLPLVLTFPHRIQVTTRQTMAQNIAAHACQLSVLEERLPTDITKLAIAKAISEDRTLERASGAVRTAP